MDRRSSVIAAIALSVGAAGGWLAATERVVPAGGADAAGDTPAVRPADAPGQLARAEQKEPAPVGKDGKKPNILVIFGDDIGQTNVSAYSRGLMGFTTPN